MDIIGNYLEYIRDVNSKRERTTEVFHASAAGRCYRQQMYAYYNHPQDPLDDKSLALLRLGTIIHEDVDKSNQLFIAKNTLEMSTRKVYSEERVELPDLRVVGTFDAGEYIESENKFKLYDLKSAAAYKWQTHFGLKKNRIPNSDANYKLQLGTYAAACIDKFLDPTKDHTIEMYLLWYNKNTSAMRLQPIPNEWIDNALEYWGEVNELLEELGNEYIDDLEPGFSPGVPFQDWECKYCPYYSTCPSILADKKSK
jgi:hypothetical protein